MKSEFERIKEYFDELDSSHQESNKKLVYSTEKGIFGTSDLEVVYEFFKKIKPNPTDVFIDIGSGDGRVVLIASLFCHAIGVEFDKNLVQNSKEHANNLGKEVEFLCEDYEEFDYSQANIIYSYADHFFTPSFIERLKEEFKGQLYVYQGVFLPEGVKKGPKIWAKDTPIISYEF